MGVPARHREASAKADGPRAAQALAPRAGQPSRVIAGLDPRRT